MKYLLLLLTTFNALFTLSALDERRNFSRKSRSIQHLFQESPPESPRPSTIVFSEFDEPETPNLEKITLSDVAFRFRSKSKQPITIVPSGKAFTMDNRDRGDKSHDKIFDVLKTNLDQKSQEIQECLQEALISQLLSQEIPPIQEKKINFKRIQKIEQYAKDLRFKELEIIANNISKKFPRNHAVLKETFYRETQELLNKKITKAKDLLGQALLDDTFSKLSFEQDE